MGSSPLSSTRTTRAYDLSVIGPELFVVPFWLPSLPDPRARSTPRPTSLDPSRPRRRTRSGSACSSDCLCQSHQPLAAVTFTRNVTEALCTSAPLLAVTVTV